MTRYFPLPQFNELTLAGRRAMRRYAQGYSHGLQGRTDLIGQCPHYDEGHAAAKASKA